MNQLRLRTFIAAPPDVCYRLALTIPVQERALSRVRARAERPVRDRPLRPGESVTWGARWLGLPWRMTTLIVTADEPKSFVDEQVRGPFGYWRHEHRFLPCDAGTAMYDDVDWSAPFGAIGQAVVAAGFGRFVASLLRDHNQRLAGEIDLGGLAQSSP